MRYKHCSLHLDATIFLGRIMLRLSSCEFWLERKSFRQPVFYSLRLSTIKDNPPGAQDHRAFVISNDRSNAGLFSLQLEGTVDINFDALISGGEGTVDLGACPTLPQMIAYQKQNK
jgi:hypothetical protein